MSSPFWAFNSLFSRRLSLVGSPASPIGRSGSSESAWTSSGAAEDTAKTFAASAAAVPHRPVKATGRCSGARIIEVDGEPAAGTYRIHSNEVVVIDPAAFAPDANDIARHVLAAVGTDPSGWWIGASGLAATESDAAERFLDAIVAGVRHVRLYLAKQQFDQ